MTKINILCQPGERNKKYMGAMEGKQYNFQKRNKLKTLLRHMYFQAKTVEPQGVQLWCKDLTFSDLISVDLQDNPPLTSMVLKGSLWSSLVRFICTFQIKFIYLLKCKANLAYIFDNYTVIATIL